MALKNNWKEETIAKHLQLLSLHFKEENLIEDDLLALINKDDFMKCLNTKTFFLMIKFIFAIIIPSESKKKLPNISTTVLNAKEQLNLRNVVVELINHVKMLYPDHPIENIMASHLKDVIATDSRIVNLLLNLTTLSLYIVLNDPKIILPPKRFSKKSMNKETLFPITEVVCNNSLDASGLDDFTASKNSESPHPAGKPNRTEEYIKILEMMSKKVKTDVSENIVDIQTFKNQCISVIDKTTAINRENEQLKSKIKILKKSIAQGGLIQEPVTNLKLQEIYLQQLNVADNLHEDHRKILILCQQLEKGMHDMSNPVALDFHDVRTSSNQNFKEYLLLSTENMKTLLSTLQQNKGKIEELCAKRNEFESVHKTLQGIAENLGKLKNEVLLICDNNRQPSDKIEILQKNESIVNQQREPQLLEESLKFPKLDFSFL